MRQHTHTHICIHIYRTRKKKHLQVWRGEYFSWWYQVGFLKLGWNALWKSSSKNFQLLSPLYIYKKNVYLDDKLEEDWKCKARRKTDWKMIQSVKQVGKRSGVWKKVGKKYFFDKKNRKKLPIKIFLWKKKFTSRLTSSTWQCMYVIRLKVRAFVDKNLKVRAFVDKKN